MNLRLWLGAVVLALGLMGCAPSPEETAALRSVFAQVRAERYDLIEARAGENLRSPDLHDGLERVGALLPDGQPRSVTRLNWSFRTFDGGRFVSMLDQYDWGERLVLVETTMQFRDDRPPTIEGLRVNVVSAADAARNRFDVLDAPWRQQLFFAGMAMSVALMLTAFLGALFTRGFRWWSVTALLGAPIFAMNWATGAVNTLVGFGLVNAGVFRGPSPLDPWTVKFQMPLGAAILLTLLIGRWQRNRS